MKCTFDELCRKEVINVCDGRRLGFIDDCEIELCDGKILVIIVPSPPRCFGLIRGDRDNCIPFSRIVKIGDDVILVDFPPGKEAD